MNFLGFTVKTAVRVLVLKTVIVYIKRLGKTRMRICHSRFHCQPCDCIQFTGLVAAFSNVVEALMKLVKKAISDHHLGI